ncbi:MAG: TSUP family transporter [Clostridia bacterium]|nr:TSUP family transporter [Clostridia bacterium]
MTDVHRTSRFAALIVCGLAAGVINGLLGAGGGIILVLALSHLCKHALPDKRDIFANALTVTIALTLISTLLYIRNGNAPPADLTRFVLPAAVGGLTGGLLLQRISSAALKRIFAILLVVSGAIMILR